MDELLGILGGPSGVFALLLAAGLLFWRIKIPQLGIDYLQRELEINRKEIAEADKERVELRGEIKEMRHRLKELDTDFLHCLADREKCRRHVRQLEQQIRRLGEQPVVGNEER